METCKNCGRPLNDPNEELCDACRAAAQARAPGRKMHHARRRMNRTTRNMLILVCILAVIFAALCATATILYSRYSPEKFLFSVDTALSAGDTRALGKILVSDELSVSEEGCTALCRAFAEPEPRSALLQQLEAQIADENAPAGDYPALRIVRTPVFFGYCSYAVEVKSVSLFLTAPLQNLILSLDDIPRSGTVLSDGILYENLFPGLYRCSVSGMTIAGQSVQGSPAALALFSSEEPFVFGGALPVASVTVSGCIRDDAVITLDGVTVPQKPVQGRVSLPQVVPGSSIGYSYTAPWGSVFTSYAEFSDLSVTDLVFPEPAAQGGVPSAPELGQIITAHYASYLNAINTQNPVSIDGCTPEYASALAGTVATDVHKANLYVMLNAECSPAAVKGSVTPEQAMVSCCARLSYTVTNRESNTTESQAEYQIYTLIWQDGWKVSSSQPATEEFYNTAAPELLP